MLTLAKSYVDSLGLNLEAEVGAFRAALAAHRGTVNQPAPVALPIIEAIIQAGGYVIKDDATLPHEPLPPLPLPVLKEQLKTQVDTAAEAARLKYITPGSGQALEYQAVTEEARRYQSDPAPIAMNYPALSASLGIDRNPTSGAIAATLAEVAAGVLYMQAQWSAVGSAIRHTRLKTKADIDAATTEAAARAVVAAIVWP